MSKNRTLASRRGRLWGLAAPAVVAALFVTTRSTAAPLSPNPYWDDLSWNADSASVRHTLETRGYYFADEATPGVHKYIGPHEADLRVAFVDGHLTRVAGTLKDAHIEPHVRVLLSHLDSRFGTPDSVIRSGKRLPPSSASAWESWDPALAAGFVWHRKAERAELLLLRKSAEGAPLLMLTIESSAFSADGLVHNLTRRGREYIASHPELDEPLLGRDQSGPLGPGWTLLSRDEALRISVLRPLKRQADGSYLGWVRFDYLAPMDDGVQRRMFRSFTDCRRHRYRVSHASLYDADGQSTVSGTPVDGPSNWHGFTHDSENSTAFGNLCLLIRANR